MMHLSYGMVKLRHQKALAALKKCLDAQKRTAEKRLGAERIQFIPAVCFESDGSMKTIAGAYRMSAFFCCRCKPKRKAYSHVLMEKGRKIWYAYGGQWRGRLEFAPAWLAKRRNRRIGSSGTTDITRMRKIRSICRMNWGGQSIET